MLSLDFNVLSLNSYVQIHLQSLMFKTNMDLFYSLAWGLVLVVSVNISLGMVFLILPIQFVRVEQMLLKPQSTFCCNALTSPTKDKPSLQISELLTLHCFQVFAIFAIFSFLAILVFLMKLITKFWTMSLHSSVIQTDLVARCLNNK